MIKENLEVELGSVGVIKLIAGVATLSIVLPVLLSSRTFAFQFQQNRPSSLQNVLRTARETAIGDRKYPRI